MGPLDSSLLLVPIGLETLAVFVFGHFLTSLLDQRTHANLKTFVEKGGWEAGSLPREGLWANRA